MVNSMNTTFWREFMDLYREHPELWKVDSEEYKNRSLRNWAYTVLLEKYKEVDPNATVSVVKSKLNTLRSCYRRELRKVEKSEQSGIEDDLYVPTLWYYKDLDFLRDQTASHGEEESLAVDSTDYDYDSKQEIAMCSSSSSHSTKKKKIYQQPKELFFQKMGDPLDNIYDEAEIYGRSWASEYRKLTPEQQLYAKKHIDDVLFQGRLGKLNCE